MIKAATSIRQLIRRANKQHGANLNLRARARAQAMRLRRDEMRADAIARLKDPRFPSYMLGVYEERANW